MEKKIFILLNIFLFSVSWATPQDKDFIFNIAECYHDGEQMIYEVAERDKKGRTIDYKETFVEFQKNNIRITAKDRKGERKRILTEKSVVYDAESSGFLLRGYPFKSKQNIYFKLLVDYEKVYTLEAQMIGEERIKVPMGEFNCYNTK